VALADTVKSVAQEEAERGEDETCSKLEQVSKPARGPSTQPGSYRDVEQRTGIAEEEVETDEEGFRANLAQKPQGGRSPGPTPGSYRAIEERTGINLVNPLKRRTTPRYRLASKRYTVHLPWQTVSPPTIIDESEKGLHGSVPSKSSRSKAHAGQPKGGQQFC